MITGARVLGAAGAFMLAVDIVYWLVTYEYAGMFLLGVMAVGLLFAAGYLAAAYRGARYPADQPELRPEDGAGGYIGAFAAASTWPIVLAGGVLVSLAGLVYGPWLFVPGMVITVAALLGWTRESDRA